MAGDQATGRPASLASMIAVRRIATRTRVVTIASALGWGLGVTALVITIGWPSMGSDADAYWLATRRLIDGQKLYDFTSVAAPAGAYFYAPLFAQLIAPVALLPRDLFVWTWRIVGFLALRYLAGSWRATGLWLLLPLTLAELAHANVTFLVGAASLAALRGREELAAWAGALKFGPAVLLPYLWFRGERRRLWVGLGTLAAALAASVALSPAAWADYVVAMGDLSQGSNRGLGEGELLTILPSVGLDFVLRATLGLAAVLVAARRGWPVVAYAASVLAAPTLWATRLVPLLAVWRFRSSERG